MFLNHVKSTNLLSPRHLMQQLGLRPLAELGQNFMVDGALLRSLVADVDLKSGDAVIEIGPGTGQLTRLLAESDCPLCAFEIDRGLSAYLEGHFKDREQVQIIHADVLEKKHAFSPLFLQALSDFNKQGFRVRVVSNLPYHISTPFCINLLEQKGLWHDTHLLVQREFADRLKEKTGSKRYGPIGVLGALFLEVELLRKVPPQVFWPAPEVASAYIRLKPKKDVELPSGFSDFLHNCFTQRRKTFVSVLKKTLKLQHGAELLEKIGLRADVRVESVSPQELYQLFLDAGFGSREN